LRKFSSIDEAMRYVIAYVTEYPENDLNAYVNAVGTYSGLTATVQPISIISDNLGLSTDITAVGKDIIVGKMREYLNYST
jgi:hypothetical protein